MRDLFQDREEWITPWWINMNKILLGKISYLNVLPIYYPLENQIIKNNFKIIEGIPAHLNHLASQGKLDLSGTSSIEYAKNFEI
jgi:chorismate dehydratase